MHRPPKITDSPVTIQFNLVRVNDYTGSPDLSQQLMDHFTKAAQDFAAKDPRFAVAGLSVSYTTNER